MIGSGLGEFGELRNQSESWPPVTGSKSPSGYVAAPGAQTDNNQLLATHPVLFAGISGGAHWLPLSGEAILSTPKQRPKVTVARVDYSNDFRRWGQNHRTKVGSSPGAAAADDRAQRQRSEIGAINP